MKKLLAVLIAVMMSVSVFAVAAVPAFAVESPTATTAKPKGPVITINGNNDNGEVRFTPDPNDPYTITFEYDGDGTLIGWDENCNNLGLVEGTDYTRTDNANGTMTLKFVSDKAKADYDNGDVIVNAIVKYPEQTSATTKKNESPKSPGTGIAASVIAGTVAVAGAGFAVLSATKKKDAE